MGVVLFHSTITSVLWFSPGSPERQLSNSCKCVKPNLYFLTGCNIWVLNKEEQIDVWPSLRVSRIRVENAAVGAQHSQQSNARVLGWLSHESWAPPPQPGIKKVRDNSRLEVHTTYFTRQWDTESGNLNGIQGLKIIWLRTGHGVICIRIELPKIPILNRKNMCNLLTSLIILI